MLIQLPGKIAWIFHLRRLYVGISTGTGQSRMLIVEGAHVPIFRVPDA